MGKMQKVRWCKNLVRWCKDISNFLPLTLQHPNQQTAIFAKADKNRVAMQLNNNGMKRKNDNKPKKGHEDDFGFLDDRMQLLNTIREMINIEFEHRRVRNEGNPHPENPPPDDTGRDPPDFKPKRTLWQRIMSLFSSGLL